MIGVASRPLALLFRLYLAHPTDTRIYTFALVGGVKRLLALVLLLFRFNTQTSQPNTLLTLTYTLTQTRINQYCSLTSSPHVCKTVPARAHPPPPAIPERPRAAHSRGSAATESPRASAISCAKEICTRFVGDVCTTSGRQHGAVRSFHYLLGNSWSLSD